jgi:phosphate transport system substrate-binding protein
MRASFSKLAVAAFLAGPLLAGNAALAETWRLAGTGGAMAMVEQIAAGFADATGVTIEVIPGLGSKGGIRATADGAFDLAVSARPLAPEEASMGLTAMPMARTALVFVTSHRQPNSVKSAELTGIFKATNPKWADGSPMNLILRTRFDSDTILLGQHFEGMSEAIEAARLRPELPIAPTDQDNATLAERMPGSFVQAGLSQIVTEKRNLRFVPIDGVEPSLETLESGKYPHKKDFHIVFSAKTKAVAERLLEFTRSEKGRRILRETGNLPIAERGQ